MNDAIHNNTVTTLSGYIRLPQVLELVPVSKATLYRWVAEKTFPRQRFLTPTGSTVAWLVTDVLDWIESKRATNDGTFDGISDKEAAQAA